MKVACTFCRTACVPGATKMGEPSIPQLLEGAREALPGSYRGPRGPRRASPACRGRKPKHAEAKTCGPGAGQCPQTNTKRCPAECLQCVPHMIGELEKWIRVLGALSLGHGVTRPSRGPLKPCVGLPGASRRLPKPSAKQSITSRSLNVLIEHSR